MPTSERYWEHFAQTDPQYYILTNPRDLPRFWQTGQDSFAVINSSIAPYVPSRSLAIEIGSGIGRLAFPCAEAFESVVAIDISNGMLLQLAELARQRGVTNITTCHADDEWPKNADLIYSKYVFQHIPEFEMIDAYIRRSFECLRPGGVAYFQFDTRPETLLNQIRNFVPDRILPRKWRRGIRRVRRDADTIDATVRSAGFNIVAVNNRQSAEHTVICTKPLHK